MAFYLQVVQEHVKPMVFGLLEQNMDRLHQTVQIRAPSPAGLWLMVHWAFKEAVMQTGHTQPGKENGSVTSSVGGIVARMCVDPL